MKKILLLGNGLNRAYGSGSWDKVIKDCSSDQTINFETDMPACFKIVIASHNDVSKSLDLLYKDSYKPFDDEQNEVSELAVQYQKILSLGFDHIYTTNYTYELEAAARPKREISKSIISKSRKYLSDNKYKAVLDVLYDDNKTKRGFSPFLSKEVKYKFYSYNEVKFNNCSSNKIIKNSIWHIHGECSNTSSLVMSYQHYANYLLKLEKALNRINFIERLQSKSKYDELNKISLSDLCWIKGFLSEDVFVLGFGFDYSEFDLWWLLSIKNEKYKNSKLYFYLPNFPKEDRELKCQNQKTKEDLLRCYNDVVQIIKINVSQQDDYQAFYKFALDDISSRLSNV